MTREEVRKKYGLKTEFRKNAFSDNTTDDFGFCHVYYNDEGKCEAVEVFDAEVYIDDGKIFSVSADEAKSVENSLECDEDGMLSVEKSTGITTYDGETESILFGIKGYYGKEFQYCMTVNVCCA